MIQPMLQSCAGLDVHKASVVCTVLLSLEDGSTTKKTSQHGTFRENLQQLAEYLVKQNIQLAVMESTGIYWHPVYAALEDAGVPVSVVNASHVKKVPGRKTDVLDSEWLAELARCGLLRASFVPTRDFREIRLLTRYRTKLVRMLASEKNRLSKQLESAGIKLACVVSDINGVSARQMISDLIDNHLSPDQIAKKAKGTLRKKDAELKAALLNPVSDRHRLLFKKIQQHIFWIENSVKELDELIVAAIQPYQEYYQLLQTIPGIDQVSAAVLLAEIGTDMSKFGNASHLVSWAGLCPGQNESAGKKNLDESEKVTNI